MNLTNRNLPSFHTFLISCIFILTSFNVSAQKNSDIGIFAGTSYYMGDLNPSAHYAAPSFALGPIFRYNFNVRNSIRFHGFYHKLSGSNLNYNGYNPGNIGTEFDAKFVDLGLDFEFNWKDYKTAFRRTKSSPYIFAGVGYGLFIGGSQGVKSHLTIPFGLGYKANVGRWLSVGAEVSARKAWSDKVDGFTNPELPGTFAPFGNRDWYYFTGVFVTYKFFKFWDDCPAYDN
ncbi:DUF6089 family protein [Bacteroidota bacterium]